MKEKYACPSHITQDTQDTPGHTVTLNCWSFIYCGSQGCLEDFTSSEGLWGSTYIHICDIKERLGIFGVEPHFLPLSFGFSILPPWLETALQIVFVLGIPITSIHNINNSSLGVPKFSCCV